MPYTITLSNGTVLTTIADATVDNTTSLNLIGRNYSGYGALVAESFVYLLENFSKSTAPSNPLVGQLWYNSSTQTLNLWDGTAWVLSGLPANGLIQNQNFGVQNGAFLVENTSCPTNQKTWRVRVSDTAPYIGMLVFEALNDDGSLKNTVMALDGVNNLILGAVTYS